MADTVLVVGIDPDLVDYSAPGMPPGFTAERVHAELRALPDRFAAAGLSAVSCSVAPGPAAGDAVAAALARRRFSCVLVGGGVRMPAGMAETLEAVVAAVRDHAPDAPMSFTASPADAVAAAQRALARRR